MLPPGCVIMVCQGGEYDTRNARITFLTHDQARHAVADKEAVFNNRFIQVRRPCCGILSRACTSDPCLCPAPPRLASVLSASVQVRFTAPSGLEESAKRAALVAYGLDVSAPGSKPASDLWQGISGAHRGVGQKTGLGAGGAGRGAGFPRFVKARGDVREVVMLCVDVLHVMCASSSSRAWHS